MAVALGIIPQFPASVAVGSGLSLVVANGIFTFSLSPPISLNNPTFSGCALNVRAGAAFPVIAYFESAGATDAATAAITIKDAYQGTRGANAGNPLFAGDGNGPGLNFQTWSRRGTYLDSIQINPGLISAAANAEMSLIDIAGYRNGTSEVFFTFDCSQDAFFPGATTGIYSLGTTASKFKDGNFSGTLSATTLAIAANVFIGGFITAGSFIKTGSTTVSGLGTAASAGAGARSFVTDATATTFHSTVVGGGSNKVSVISDGTNWLIGG